MTHFFKLSILPVALLSFGANAQSTCPSYAEQTVQPLKAEKLWEELSAIPNVKGEFETTPAFEARVAQAASSFKGPIIVESQIQRSLIEYDADTSVLAISGFAFSNYLTNFMKVPELRSTLFNNRFTDGFIEATISMSESIDGSYIGQNAMGVKVEIAKVKRNRKVIFDREAKSTETLFSDTSKANIPVVSWQGVPPDMAKHAKETGRAAFVFTPKAPYYAKGKFSWGNPTMRNPREIDETIEVAVGDIQCALFLNANGKVFGAVETR